MARKKRFPFFPAIHVRHFHAAALISAVVLASVFASELLAAPAVLIPDAPRAVPSDQQGVQQGAGQQGAGQQGAGQQGAGQEKPWKTEGAEAVPSMLGYAQMLNERRRQVPPAQQIEDFRTLVLIADDLSRLQLEEGPRNIAFQIKGQALLGLHATGDPNARAQLMEFVTANVNNEDANIRKSAYFLNLSVLVGELLKGQSTDPAELVAQTETVLQTFPGDMDVGRQLFAMADQLAQSGSPQAAGAVLQKLLVAMETTGGDEPTIFAASIRDRIHLIEIGFTQMAMSMANDPNADKSAFIQVVKTLAAREGMGRDGFFEVVNAARWMESQGLVKEATETYEILEATTRTNPDKEIVELAARDREMAMKRMSSRGTKVQISGQNSDGQEFNLEQVKGKKVVGLFFWSAEVPRSVSAMQAIMQIWGRYNDRGFELVAICIDEDVGQARGLFVNGSPPWISLFQTNDAHRALQAQLGVQNVPHMILIDEQQVVTDTGISLQTADTILTAKLGAPPAQNDGSAPGNPGGG